MTGILVGPDLIMPSEWLPCIWGGKEPAFESAEQGQQVLGTIMGRYNEIAQNLDGAPDDLNPVYWEADGGMAIAADWAEGFSSAIDLRPGAWASLMHDTDASILVLPILALCSDEDGNDLIDFDVATKTEMFVQAPDIIPTCVLVYGTSGVPERVGPGQFKIRQKLVAMIPVLVVRDANTRSVVDQLMDWRV